MCLEPFPSCNKAKLGEVCEKDSWIVFRTFFKADFDVDRAVSTGNFQGEYKIEIKKTSTYSTSIEWDLKY